ncbi:MAG: isoprenylcysteine carboxylmethyltransferase family protein [Alphaproteobacteria bacterium]|uniref:methyltransferase family protein n=1 Tax=Brevundimonas sp. TaxID=1871086 RepID=UPI001DFA6FD1|nr:isoprenylcysteine carboxylmethyltransferase family protein [Alphaproteobacteria bacterium]MBU1520323.1 isoprenylcysteine carboxylmethyltransferase family protein [Alphaproteobacteria bacterium]MBU2030808.1 isoprenylcysteine carboxylmethyltransferase family protein [Alphaproteobacteria bacterium]MBU2163500.1 isoprenylcysteine carboxylmethyltransferase family protein [Alphaproteobacteria bacterium]MBU2231605.1 isoprenylcysteine carboxylmethyltransferase family protein [Alphaproteobacteria bact
MLTPHSSGSTRLGGYLRVYTQKRRLARAAASTALPVLAGIACEAGSPATDRDALRRVQLRRKALLGGVILAFLAAAAVIRPAAEGTVFETALVMVGVGSIVAAIIGRAWCSLYIGGRKTHEIVDRGPYSVSRNPLYVFSFLAAFGVGAQTGSLVLTAAVLGLTMLVLWRTVLCEEAWLSASFGEDYTRYRRRIPRFWPRRSAWRDETPLLVDTTRFVRTVMDGALLLLAPPIIHALGGARAFDLTPTLTSLP